MTLLSDAMSVLALGLSFAVPAEPLPVAEKIVIVDEHTRALVMAAMRVRSDELSKDLFCSPGNAAYNVPSCRQVTDRLPTSEAAYRKALVDVGHPLTACEETWVGYQSLKQSAQLFRWMASNHHPDGGLTRRAVEYLARAEEQSALARTRYQAFKHAGCVGMRPGGRHNVVPLRADDPLNEWN